MARIGIAGLVGGIVYFVWGMLVWMVIPLHMPTISGLPDEARLTEVLKAQGLESGVYVAPWSDNEADWEDPESAFTKNHVSGPLYSVFYHRDGLPPMDPKVMVGGLVINILAACLAAGLLYCALPLGGGFLGRVGFVTGLGVFVAIVAHLGYWNWMHFATDWTLGFVLDTILGWALAGLAIAAIIKARKQASANA